MPARAIENADGTLPGVALRHPGELRGCFVEVFPCAYRRLHLMALDRYDLALSKLERNSQKDRDDVRFLARTVPFDLDILQERYATELRWQLSVPKEKI